MSENTQLGPFMDAELTSQPEVWAYGNCPGQE